MASAVRQETPLRFGVFSMVEEADQAVAGLLAAGFTKDQITVICSDETRERHFKQFEHQQPAGEHTPAAIATGGTIGGVRTADLFDPRFGLTGAEMPLEQKNEVSHRGQAMRALIAKISARHGFS